MTLNLQIGSPTGADYMPYVQSKSIRVSTNADGSQGVMDLVLINPPTIPTVDTEIVLTDHIGLTNYDFEANSITGWGEWDPDSKGTFDVEQVATAGVKIGKGTYQGVITHSVAGGGVTAQSAQFAVAPGEYTEFSMLIGGEQTGIDVAMWYASSTGAWIQNIVETVAPSGSRHYFRLGPAPTGTALGTVLVSNSSTTAVPNYLCFDDVLVGPRLFKGYIRVVKLSQFKDTVYASISCQDDAEPAGIPTLAVFGLSDNPDNSTTYGFRSLELQTDAIDGNIKTVGTAVIYQPGLFVGQNFHVTSANYQLTAQEYTIQKIDVSYEVDSAPIYTISFGDPIVKLSQVVAKIPDGYITTTMIADNAISTPKLQANSVTTLSNEGATVVIDENGITIEEGALNFSFPGGENLVLNSGFELGPYVAPATSHTWTSTANFNDTDVRAVTNITVSDGLALTGSTY